MTAKAEKTAPLERREAEVVRAESTPERESPQGALLHAQQALGNRGARSWIQAKLSVGAPSGGRERQADRVSAAVAAAPRPTGAPERGLSARVPPPADETALLRRAVGPLSPGRPLTSAERAFFEPRFRWDFRDVRLHTGGAADQAARGLGAKGFTFGRRVVLDSSEYRAGAAGRALLAHELTHVVQQSLPGQRGSEVLSRALAAPAARPAPAPAATPAPSVEAPLPERGPTPAPAAPAAAAPALIVEQGAELGTGQMAKADFIAALREGVTGAADEELAGTSYTAENCPWLQLYLRYYEGRTAERLEGDVRRYLPEAAGAASAGDYVPPIQARVRRSVAHWVRTGEITGVPEGLPDDLPGLESTGRLMMKARDGGAGGAGAAAEPAFVQSRLGDGRPLDGGVRGRMESAFGRSYGHVRIHTDGEAARLSGRYRARAFTVGEHVAFGSGEYRPGTPIGDALLAHELAHVAQQPAAAPRKQPRAAASSPALEQDADVSAVRAVVSLYRRLGDYAAGLGTNALPRLRSGLRLQRCESEHEKEVKRLGGVQAAFTKSELERQKREKLEKERLDEIERRKKAGEKDPKVAPVKDEDAKVSEEELKKHLEEKAKPPPKGKTDDWDKEVAKDGGKSFIDFAHKTIAKVKKKAESDPAFEDIAMLLKKAPPIFNAKTAKEGLELPAFGWATGDKFHVSMGWIRVADKEERDVFANIAHEVGGHIVYGEEFSWEIAKEALKQGNPEADKILADEDKRHAYFMRMAYPETEIYGELRERKWLEPQAGGFKPTKHTDDPDVDIPDKLAKIKAEWAPEVAQAILERVVAKARKDKGIRPQDVDFLLKSIKNAGFKFTIK